MPKGDFANSQDLVAIETIAHGAIVLKGGALRQVVMVNGVNFSLKSEEEQSILSQAYENFLNGLDFPVQIIIHSRKLNVEKYLQALEERRGKESSGLLQSQIAEYKEFVKSFVRENAIMTKTFLVVVPYTPVSLPSKSSIRKLWPFGKKDDGAKEQADRDEVFREALGQLKQRTTQVVDGLTGMGLNAVVLDDTALAELFYNFYNPETIERKDMKLA